MPDSEPIITVNGTPLTEGQAMTVRVAVQHFAYYLAQHGLGEDERGKGITTGYLARIGEINKLMSS
jgi:hypothetical protein